MLHSRCRCLLSMTPRMDVCLTYARAEWLHPNASHDGAGGKMDDITVCCVLISWAPQPRTMVIGGVIQLIPAIFRDPGALSQQPAVSQSDISSLNNKRLGIIIWSSVTAKKHQHGWVHCWGWRGAAQAQSGASFSKAHLLDNAGTAEHSLNCFSMLSRTIMTLLSKDLVVVLTSAALDCLTYRELTASRYCWDQPYGCMPTVDISRFACVAVWYPP